MNALSDRQQAIVETITMRLHTNEALEHLARIGHPMSERTLRREKARLNNQKFERMEHIALYFQDQHLERIDRCELVEKLMWENYHAEKDPYKRVGILSQIIGIQPYLSAYYDATRYVLEKRIRMDIAKAPSAYLSINTLANHQRETKEQREREWELGKSAEPEPDVNFATALPETITEEKVQETRTFDEEPDKETIVSFSDQKQEQQPKTDQNQINLISDQKQEPEPKEQEQPKELKEGDIIPGGKPWRWTAASAEKALKKAGRGNTTTHST